MKLLEIYDIQILLSKVGVSNFLLGLIKTIEEDFSAWKTFDKSPRLANHVDGGVIELMPVSNDTLYSYKYVNGHPKNPKENKFTVMATGQLSLVRTGEPLLVSEMTLLTALRTAATSALAAKYLANKDATVLAFIGTGAQSEFQLLAFKELFCIKELRYYDIDPEAMEKFASNMQHLDMEFKACTSASEAVVGAHMITTMTADKRNQTILTKDMITNDVFINGIGGDCPGKTELDKALVENSTVVVEYLEQSKIEGEIQQIDDYANCFELHEVISKTQNINVTTHGTVIFDSVGFALEDYSVLRYVYDLAKEHDIGKEVELIPNISNVKDLYSLIKEKL